MHLRLRHGLLVALLLLLVAGEPATAADGISVELLADRAAGGDPRDAYYVMDQVAPGAEVTRSVRIGNHGTDAVEVRTYVQGATVADGAFRFEPPADDELAAWSRTSPDQPTVEPGATATVRVTIAVPADAGEGERYGVVWAELPPDPGQTTSVVNRVGVRIYLWVGDEDPVTAFVVERFVGARDDHGRPLVETTVRNAGDRAVDLSGTLGLDGSGDDPGPLPLTGGTTMAPRERTTLLTQLPTDVATGPWTVSATVRGAGVEHRVRGHDLAIPREAGARGAAVGARPIGDDVPLWLTAIAVLAVVAAAAATVRSGVPWISSRPSRRSAGPAPRGRAPRS